MKPYWQIKDNKLYHGDCLDVLKTMPDNLIDSLVCDPPYQLSNRTLDFPYCKDCGYQTQAGFQKQGHHDFCPKCKSKNINRIRGNIKGFMGKEWDVLPSVNIWHECLRVLKPGAFAFIMSSPRQDCLSEMIYRIRKAGFNTGFTSIYWTYSSGFPKAGNVGKLVDKKLGAEREVIGKYEHPQRKNRKYQTNSNVFSQNRKGDKLNDMQNITIPATPQAKVLDGSYTGYQPKPAVEVIIVAMKPLSEKTYVEQALKNGKGITWLDDCRVPHDNESLGGGAEKRTTFKNKDGWDRPWRHDIKKEKEHCKRIKENVKTSEQNGRFPANLLVSDDCLNDGKVSKSIGGSGDKTKFTDNKSHGKYLQGKRAGMGGYQDVGSYSRYFDLDKWWIEKIKSLPESVRKCYPFLIVPKASKGEKNKGLNEEQESSGRPSGIAYNDKSGIHSEKQKGNIHPTVKPIKLMSYLIVLGSKSGDIILDPFCGSGTTLVSADIMGRNWIGMDKEKSSIEIAKHRIKDESSQIKMF